MLASCAIGPTSRSRQAVHAGQGLARDREEDPDEVRDADPANGRAEDPGHRDSQRGKRQQGNLRQRIAP